MKIVYFGTPSFAAEVLEFLLANQVAVAAVISKPDRPKGRSGAPVPTPVKEVALAHQLPLHQPEIVSSPAFAPILEACQADLFVVVAYGELIKQFLLDMPKLGCINLHASLLPHYRGAAPIQRAIMAGETETGVTIMHMVRKMDAGDMIKWVKVPIAPETTFGELERSLCTAGKEALLQVIRQFEIGEVKRVPQDHTQATFAPKIELEDCQIQWENSAEAIHNLVRAVHPYPGAWCEVKIKGEVRRLKIRRTRVVPASSLLPGEILPSAKNTLVISTADQALQLLEVQLEGKKIMSIEEFLRGWPISFLSFSV